MDYELIPLEQIKDGLLVNYHSIIGAINDEEDISSKVRGVPWRLGHGDFVVRLEGKAGGVAIEALSIRLTGGKTWRPYAGCDCEECGDEVEILTVSTEANWFYDGEDAKCVSCGHRGQVSIGDRDAWISWYEDEES